MLLRRLPACQLLEIGEVALRHQAVTPVGFANCFEIAHEAERLLRCDKSFYDTAEQHIKLISRPFRQWIDHSFFDQTSVESFDPITELRRTSLKLFIRQIRFH